MAAPAGNEADALPSRDADRISPPRNDRVVDGAPSTFPATQERPSSSFQAINSRAVAENASTSMSTAASPPNGAAVAQEASQTAQDSEAPNSHQDPSHMEDLDGSMAADVATYGTRSRNRTGNARPNYAEDQDTMDFELSSAAAATKKKPTAKDAAAADSATHNAAEAKRAQEFARLIAVNGNGASGNGDGTKESTPGASGVASSVSKKRKAAGGAPAVLTQTPPPSNSPAPTASRKLAPPSTVARETNVMTFTKHRSCLNKRGELVADDGTKLSVNGKQAANPLRRASSRIRGREVLPRFDQRIANCKKANCLRLNCRSRVSCLRASRRSILLVSNHGIPAFAFR